MIPDLEPKIGIKSGGAYSRTWGLERIGAEEATHRGKGVDVYIFDTGIKQHEVFGDRLVMEGEYNKWSEQWIPCASLGSAGCATDRHGHGTHVAGTAVGAGVGVAPEANLYAMKVLGDDGRGSLLGVAWGLDYMIEKQNEMSSNRRTVVAGMSLAAPGTSPGMAAVFETALDVGITVVVAAGNEQSDACQITPAHIPSAVTVGAIDWNDGRAWFSNWGTCTDIFAPGVSIESASHKDRTSYLRLDGTSMAAPHVVGAVALLLEEYPAAKASEVEGLLQSSAIKGRVRGNLYGASNSMLHVGTPHNMTDGGAHECKNTPGFRDVKGFRCWRWRWNWFGRCNKGGLFHRGYSEAQLVDVKKHCPVSCGLCGWRFGVPFR